MTTPLGSWELDRLGRLVLTITKADREELISLLRLYLPAELKDQYLDDKELLDQVTESDEKLFIRWFLRNIGDFNVYGGNTVAMHGSILIIPYFLDEMGNETESGAGWFYNNYALRSYFSDLLYDGRMTWSYHSDSYPEYSRI